MRDRMTPLRFEVTQISWKLRFRSEAAQVVNHNCPYSLAVAAEGFQLFGGWLRYVAASRCAPGEVAVQEE